MKCQRKIYCKLTCGALHERKLLEIKILYIDFLCIITFYRQIPPRKNVTLQLKVEHCKGVNYLEHVQAKITLTTQRRGDIQIVLTSPSGTRTTLLTERYFRIL